MKRVYFRNIYVYVLCLSFAFFISCSGDDNATAANDDAGGANAGDDDSGSDDLLPPFSDEFAEELCNYLKNCGIITDEELAQCIVSETIKMLPADSDSDNCRVAELMARKYLKCILDAECAIWDAAAPGEEGAACELTQSQYEIAMKECKKDALDDDDDIADDDDITDDDDNNNDDDDDVTDDDDSEWRCGGENKCPDGFYCGADGICRLIENTCESDADCDGGKKCIGGVCIDESIPQGEEGGQCYSDNTCNEGLVCGGGVCVKDNGCLNECISIGEKSCDGDHNWKYCVDIDGCLKWSAPSACDAGEECRGDGVCGKDECAETETRCNGLNLERCYDADGNLFMEWSFEQTCVISCTENGCTGCTKDSDCSDPTPFCDIDTHHCMECYTGNDCGENMECIDNTCYCSWESCSGECCAKDDICYESACCMIDCGGKECGDDGCGGSCGDCKSNEICNAAQICECVPDCYRRECGDDGCGDECGECGEYETCQDHQCVTCTPDCDGKNCGDNGCGGNCGICSSESICDEGVCICNPANVLIIADDSGSMSSNNKFEHQLAAMEEKLPLYDDKLRFGLLLHPDHTYTSTGVCGSMDIKLDIGANNAANVMDYMNSASTGEVSPIGKAAETAMNYDGLKDSTRRNYTVFIFDGDDTCISDNLANAIMNVQSMHDIGIYTYVIGVGDSVPQSNGNDLAEAGGKQRSGTVKYYEATNEAAFKNVLEEILKDITLDCN